MTDFFFVFKQMETMHKRYTDAKKQHANMLPQSTLAVREGPKQLVTRLLKVSFFFIYFFSNFLNLIFKFI